VNRLTPNIEMGGGGNTGTANINKYGYNKNTNSRLFVLSMDPPPSAGPAKISA